MAGMIAGVIGLWEEVVVAFSTFFRLFLRVHILYNKFVSGTEASP